MSGRLCLDLEEKVATGREAMSASERRKKMQCLISPETADYLARMAVPGVKAMGRKIDYLVKTIRALEALVPEHAIPIRKD